ncbi:glycosyltransferase family 4 protein [Nocardioides sp. YIM 152588]|uniref:glycosyltransferase family 4 protein n=1 Tax=Nocardioides sp. YIM 152588 TaxID=3158259 RepID=UPI0032E3D44D
MAPRTRGAGDDAHTLAGRRIAVVNWRDLDHSLAGGAEIYADQFARALVEGGAEVCFVTSREPGQRRRERRDGMTVRRAGGRLGFYPASLLWLARHRRRWDAVIDPAGGLPVFSPLVLRRGTPALLVVHHVHQDQFGAHFPAPVAAFGRWLERVAMRRVYRRQPVVAVSTSTVREMRRRLGWSGAIGVLENGADLPEPGSVDAGAKDPDRIVVLGRLVAHKRVDLVLGALHDLRNEPGLAGRDLRLDVIGRGPERERLEELAQRLGVADVVTFHGFVSDEEKARLLDRASLHVCASDAEGWGQVVIDAAGRGVPTVARDVPGLRDSIRDGETGWLVPEPVRRPTAGDADTLRRSLAQAMASALGSTASRSDRVHRAAACEAWATKFDWSQMRRQARRLTEGILTGEAPAAPDHHHLPRARVAD